MAILTSVLMPTEEEVETLADLLRENLNAQRVLYTILILAACIVVIRILLVALDRGMKRMDVEKGLRKFLHSAVHVFLWLIAAIIVLSYLGIPMSSLVAVLGIIGLAVSLAVQGTLSNLAGGMMVLASKPFKGDDLIEVGETKGIVQEVGLVYTKVKTNDNKIICIPNGKISAEKIINHTTQTQRRVDLTFTLRYDAPVEEVKRIMQAVAAAHPKVLFTPAPFARVSAYQEGGVEYSVQVWCATGDYWPVYYDMLEQVGEALKEQGLGLTSRYVTVHIAEGRAE